jgi:hypothetical protein
MRRLRSEKSFSKYKPHVGRWRRFLDNRKKEKREKAFLKHNKKFRRQGQPQVIIHKKKRAPLAIPFWLKIVLLVAFIVCWIILLAYLPYFKITKVVCAGLDNISKSDIENFVRDNYFNKGSVLPEANYFMVNAGKISEGLKNKFVLESVSVHKIFPDTLEIDVKEKEPQLVYDNGKKYFLMDANGVAVKYLFDAEPNEFIKHILSVPSSSTSTEPLVTITHNPGYARIKKLCRDYPILYDKRNLDVTEKEQDILPAEIIAGVRSLQKAIEGSGVGDVRYYILSDLNTGVTAITENKYKLYFSLNSDPANQILNLKNILSSNQPAEYVDLRFGNRVYWK